jgi:catechol 2,3-dioxygenase-like lactoylglutathione lyase family enzyme
MITALPRIAIAVDDFDDAMATFGDGFGVPVADFSGRTVPALGAHVAMCVPEGGSNIELMSPADPDKPLSQALQKFLRRRGDGLYALMLEAPDPDAEAVVLSDRGLEVLPLMAGAGGRDVHPRSTHGVLIRVYPDNSVTTGPFPGQPPGLSGIMKVVVATADASIAAHAYESGLGLEVRPAVRDDERGVMSVSCQAPRGGVIELVSPVDPGNPFAQEIDRCVKEDHGGMYALVLHADDPQAARAALSDRGLATRPTPIPHIAACGTRFLIE